MSKCFTTTSFYMTSHSQRRALKQNWH